MITLPHGETNVTLACQNRCVSCNHFVPLQDPWFADVGVIMRDLTMAAKLMHFRVYNLVGGEPTLHPRIVEIAHCVRGSGICDRVEITSNGQSCARWADALYQAIDDLIITPYKLTDEQRALIIDKCADHDVSLQWHPVIFTYAAYKRTHSAGVAANMYRSCWYKANRNVIDEGYFHRCCIGRFIPELLQGEDRNAEAISLEGLTEDKLTAYLRQPETPEMCFVCGANCAPQLAWREQADRGKWMEESLA
jgi:cyclic pyranopterin phosphate synthase